MVKTSYYKCCPIFIVYSINTNIWTRQDIKKKKKIAFQEPITRTNRL